MIAAIRPTLEEAIAQTYDLLTRFDDNDRPCCANCGDEIDDTTAMMLCSDCALDTVLAQEDD